MIRVHVCPKCGKPIGRAHGYMAGRLLREHFAAEHPEAWEQAMKIRDLMAAFHGEHKTFAMTLIGR